MRIRISSLSGVNTKRPQFDWLTKDQGVQLDRASEQKQEFEAAQPRWKRISWSGESKEWGPATVGFAFTEGGNGQVLTVAYWIPWLSS
ncbi:MAG TPA: hypothetical protein VNY04_01800 [Chthoniobacterales bacterium]|nr:hypothetical protein [Chthoniobacterales bacterium]